jgi:hypothetical protein
VADPSTRRVGAQLIGLLVVVLAGCGSIAPSTTEDDASAAVLLTARVIDITGVPVPGARFKVKVFDDPNAVLGQATPPVIDDEYTAAQDGTFIVHLAPTAKHRTIGRAHGGLVQFMVFVINPDRALVFPFGTARELGPDAWAGEPVDIDIRPGPEYWVPLERLLPASQPLVG